MTSARRIAFALLLVASAGQAATLTWTGAVNNRWSVGGNWIGGAAPSPGDALVFGGANTNLLDDLPAGFGVDSMTFAEGIDYVLTGNGITLAHGVSTTCCGSAFLTLDLPITLTASQTFDGGSQVFYVAGPISLNGFNLQFASNVSLTGSLSGTGNVTFANGAYFPGSSNAAGTITAAGDLQFTGTVANTQLVKNGGAMQAVNTLADTAVHNAALRISHAVGIPGGYTGPDILHTGNLLLDHGTLTIAAGEQVITTGTVTLDAPTLDLINTGAQAGDSITIIDNDGTDPVQGTFANLPKGATFSSGGTLYRITYAGGTGNDVVVTVLGPSAVPAANDVVLLLLAIALAVIALRKV